MNIIDPSFQSPARFGLDDGCAFSNDDRFQAHSRLTSVDARIVSWDQTVMIRGHFCRKILLAEKVRVSVATTSDTTASWINF